MSEKREYVGLIEALGLNPIGPAVKQTIKAAFGKGKIPPTRIGVSSTRIFKPQIGIPTWLGIKPGGTKAPVYNLFNRAVAPLNEAYSVKVTYCKDFRGGKWCYDGHMGTDFAIPVGTPIVACAPGKVVVVSRDMSRGGLRVFIDHGQGLITTYCHLSRALVTEGSYAGRGDVIALSGASGSELVVFFPWVSPHLHLNVFLNTTPTDPFAIEENGETSMWLNGNNPVPHAGPPEYDYEPTEWDEQLIENAISECIEEKERERLRAIKDIEKRAMETINLRTFSSPLFTSFPPMYKQTYKRRPVLDLPFKSEDFDGITFPD